MKPAHAAPSTRNYSIFYLMFGESFGAPTSLRNERMFEKFSETSMSLQLGRKILWVELEGSGLYSLGECNPNELIKSKELITK